MGEVRIAVRIKPGSSRARVGGGYGPDQQLIVAVNAPPVDGAANEAVVKAIATAFGIRPRQVSLVSGHAARTKIIAIDIDDASEPGLRSQLQSLLANGT